MKSCIYYYFNKNKPTKYSNMKIINHRHLNILIFILMVFCLSTLLVSCRSTSHVINKANASGHKNNLPSWAFSGSDTSFPEAFFLTAVGEGGSLENSDKTAMIRVVEQIQVSMKSDLSLFQQETERDGLTESSRDLSLSINSSVDIKRLGGLSIVNRHYDKGARIYYSLAALDREKTSAALIKEINDSFGLTNEYYKTAEKHKEKREITEAIHNYVLAIEEYKKSKPRVIILSAVAANPNETDLVKIPSLAHMEGSLIELISRLRLKIVSGNQQKGEIGEALNQPLVVRATYEDKREFHNIKGMPLRFAIKEGSATIQNKVNTDSKGIAGSTVSRVNPAGIKHNTIEVSLNYPDFSLPLSGPSETFTYILPVKQDIRVKVKIKESNLGSKVASLSVEPLIIQHLRDQGFNVLVEGSGKADFTIRGNIKSSKMGQMEDIIFAVSDGSLKIVDNKTGLVTKEVKIEREASKGAGLSAQAAGLNSLKNTGASLGQKVALEMERLFNRETEEQ